MPTITLTPGETAHMIHVLDGKAEELLHSHDRNYRQEGEQLLGISNHALRALRRETPSYAEQVFGPDREV